MMTDKRPYLPSYSEEDAQKRNQEEQETIQGIAEVLARRSGRTPAECWTEAMDLWRVQFYSEVRPPRDKQR